jgi:hypothetical protein
MQMYLYEKLGLFWGRLEKGTRGFKNSSSYAAYFGSREKFPMLMVSYHFYPEHT